jgi:hypothetical protein
MQPASRYQRINICMDLGGITIDIKMLTLMDLQTHGKIQLGIYRKPMQTDTIIHFTSTHRLQYRLVAYIFCINRLLSTSVTEQEKQHEWNTICTIAKINGFPLQLIHNLKRKLTHTQHNISRPTLTTKKTWITFTYHSPLIHKVTNLFRSTNLHIAFWTNNTILHYLRHQSPHNKHNASGIYKLQCTTCNKSYVDQTGWSIATCYHKHIRYIRTNNPLLHISSITDMITTNQNLPYNCYKYVRKATSWIVGSHYTYSYYNSNNY